MLSILQQNRYEYYLLHVILKELKRSLSILGLNNSISQELESSLLVDEIFEELVRMVRYENNTLKKKRLQYRKI